VISFARKNVGTPGIAKKARYSNLCNPCVSEVNCCRQNERDGLSDTCRQSVSGAVVNKETNEG
jgi:hypothetical protein